MKKRKRPVVPIKSKWPVGRPPKPMPPRIPDTPQNIARILLTTPPRPDTDDE